MRALCVLLLTLPLLAGCADPVDVGPLLAQQAQLERELEGLRESAQLLDAGKPIFPTDDVAIAIDQGLIEHLITSRLPISHTAAPYDITLDRVAVSLSGAPIVTLRGRVTRQGLLTLDGAATLIGSLTHIELDTASSMLRAQIAVDHLEIERVAGIEALVSGSTLDDVAALLRRDLSRQLPAINLPVRIQQAFELPALTDGPVRLAGGRLPLAARVSRVFAAEGRLWIGVHLTVGEVGGP